MKKLCFPVMFFAILFAFQLTAFSEGETAAEPERVLTRFELMRSTDLPSRCYEVFLLEDGYYLSTCEGAARRLDAETVRKLEEAVETFGVLSWDGFEGSNPYVLDGEDFRLEIAFSDGTAVHADGNNAFPARYFEAAGAMEALLNPAPEDAFISVCGTYVYEGEGCGGDFTITLKEDGTYTFYEGYLSSYMGGGEWFQSGPQLWLTEQNGLDAEFVFLPVEDALIFAEEESDSFLYVRVPDGGRFIRTEAGETNP